jgi:hypothetical protein
MTKTFANRGGQSLSRSDICVEDLRAAAVDSYRVSRSQCTCSDHFHAVWPYVRIARGSTAVQVGRDAVQSCVAELLAGGPSRVLIAGAGDAGLLALTGRAASGAANHEILVIDRCATPLVICRRFGEVWSLPVETRQQDLLDLEDSKTVDVVVAHSILSFIAPAQRLNLLRRLNKSLSASGTLVAKVNTGRVLERDLNADYRYTTAILNGLREYGIPIPEPQDEFVSGLEAFARSQANRELAFQSLADIEALLRSASFRIQEIVPLETHRTASFGYDGNIKRHSFLVTARPASVPDN